MTDITDLSLWWVTFVGIIWRFLPRSAQMEWWWWEEWVTNNRLYLSAPPPLHNEMNIQLILEKTKMFFVSIIHTSWQNYGLVWQSVREDIFSVNTSMFFFIMIEFSRFFKRQKTGRLQYFVKLESMCCHWIKFREIRTWFQSYLGLPLMKALQASEPRSLGHLQDTGHIRTSFKTVCTCRSIGLKNTLMVDVQ